MGSCRKAFSKPPEDDFARGAGGARKHNPGKGHRNATNERNRVKAQQQRAVDRRAAAEQRYQQAVEEWNKMSPDARKLQPEFDPENFKP